MKQLKIVFMGTPDFALPSLNLLNLSPHSLLAVVTAPDRPAGRGRKLFPSPVKKWAQKNEIALYQPEKMGDSDFYTRLKQLSPDLIITVAYGKLLSQRILSLPSLGCINLHASNLPAYRGAAPIHRAVMDGAPCSGVSVIEMTDELDAGDIIMQEEETISLYDTAGMLHDRLAVRGASLLVRAVQSIAEGRVHKWSQDHARASYARPLTEDDEVIDWNRSPGELYNQIRGLNPIPGAHTFFKGKRLKVLRAAYPDTEKVAEATVSPGTVIAVGEKSLTVATGKGVIALLDLQPAGKKPMNAASFCCGYRIEPGDCLGGEQ
ncbi:MAG: methionyl-tRNA formyltransferase [Bacillota bacterium]|nr:methionyl-tRNA formyltransferase [Bacillota bacterium]